jgi:hypothetical protein
MVRGEVKMNVETCAKCGKVKARVLMVRVVRGNAEAHICREHAMRRVHGGRYLPKRGARAS